MNIVLLLIVCALFAGAALVIESRLWLNSLYERLTMIFSLAAGQLILAVQILSLATCLNSGGLFLAGLGALGLAWCGRFFWPVPAQRRPWLELWRGGVGELSSGRDGAFVLTLAAVAIGVMGLNAVAGAFLVPLGDPYHFEMPMFWQQNQSIKPFITFDPRITCTSFAGEVLGFPGLLICHSGVPWLLITSVAGGLALGTVFLLARRLGCSLRASAVAAVLPLGISTFQQYFIEADTAMCLAALWCGASVLFLLRCGDVATLSGETLTRLGCSVFCFALGCGAKNTTIFAAPFYLLVLAVNLRRFLVHPKFVRRLAGWGLAGVLCSGVPWNYAWNYAWNGNPSGPPSLQETLAGDRSLPAIWTRCCRDAALVVFDTAWCPSSARKSYDALCQKTVQFLGGRPELSDDVPVLFNFRNLHPGSGMGPMADLLLLPAIVLGIIRICRQRNPTSGAPPFPHARDFGWLLLIITGYTLVCHVLLRSQNMGLWRLMPVLGVLAPPICGLILERRHLRIAALTLTAVCVLIALGANLSMVSNRFAANNDSALQKLLLKLGKRAPASVAYQWGNQASEKKTIHEPYNSREIALLFLERASHPAVIGYVGDFSADAYYFFGSDFANHITSLVDARNPAQRREPPQDAGYLVFPQDTTIDPVEQTLWAQARGYRPFLRVDRAGVCIFLSFEKVH